MAERQETLVAASPDDLYAIIVQLGPDIVPLHKPRRARGGGWFVRVSAPRVLTAPPVPTRRNHRWVLPTLWSVIAVGGVAAVVLGVMVIAWVVNHWMWMVVGLVVLAGAAGKVRRLW